MFNNGALRLRKWSNQETMLSLILVAVFLAEAIAILVLNFEIGDALSNNLAAVSVVVLKFIATSWHWTYKMSGPVLFPLFALTVMGFWSVHKLYRCWKQTDDEIIEEAGKKFGQRFYRLWNGKISNENYHASAEEELCRMIAYYANNDKATINRIFKRSKLYGLEWDSRVGPISYDGRVIVSPIKFSDIKIQMSLSTELETTRYYCWLAIIIAIGAIFGFIGTCLSLILVMHQVDPNLAQSAMLKILIDNSSSAYGSTIYGLSLFVLAYLFEKLFKEFLIKENTLEPTFKIRAYLDYIQNLTEVKIGSMQKACN